MFVNTEVEDFLLHHGVKGQKWGVRNQSSNSRNKSLASKELRKKRVVQGIAVSGALAATAIISSILTKKGMTPVKLVNSSSSINKLKFKAQSKSVDIGASMLKKMLAKNANQRLSTFPKKIDLKGMREFESQQARLKWQKLL